MEPNYEFVQGVWEVKDSNTFNITTTSILPSLVVNSEVKQKDNTLPLPYPLRNKLSIKCPEVQDLDARKFWNLHDSTNLCSQNEDEKIISVITLVGSLTRDRINGKTCVAYIFLFLLSLIVYIAIIFCPCSLPFPPTWLTPKGNLR